MSHKWEASPHSVSDQCFALVEDKDGFGDQCGLPPSDPIHEVVLDTTEESRLGSQGAPRRVGSGATGLDSLPPSLGPAHE
jgi:hypothetical protein